MAVEDRTVAFLQLEPVDVVGIEGLVPDVVHERRVRDEEASAGVAQPLAQVVVLIAADLEPLVEATHVGEGRSLDRKAEPDQALDLGGAPVVLPPGTGEALHLGELASVVPRIRDQLRAGHGVRARTGRDHAGVFERREQASIQRLGVSVSLLRKTTTSVVAAAAPWLQAAANPRFSALVMTVSQGRRASSAAVASLEPLSTTTTWSRSPRVGRSESRQRRVCSQAFQTGMTMVAGGRIMGEFSARVPGLVSVRANLTQREP